MSYYGSYESSTKDKIEKFIEKAKEFKLRWTKKAYLKSKYLVEGVDNEVYWYYLGETSEDGITLTDCVVIDQTVNGSECELDQDKLGEWMEKNPELIPKVVGWGHSHDTMSKFFSGTDETDIERATNSKPWVSIVFSKPFSYLARIDIPTLFGKIPIEDIKIELVEMDDEKLKKECEKLIKKHITVGTTTTGQTTLGGRSYGGYGHHHAGYGYNVRRCDDVDVDKWKKRGTLEDDIDDYDYYKGFNPPWGIS